MDEILKFRTNSGDRPASYAEEIWIVTWYVEDKRGYATLHSSYSYSIPTQASKAIAFYRDLESKGFSPIIEATFL